MSEHREQVSIVMPAYNAQATIAASIESVLAQTWQDWVLIIVIDAATDQTAAIVRDYASRDSRLRVIELTQNQGAAAARNHALDAAQGEFIAFLDTDDLWHADKLATQIAFMRDSGAAMSYAPYTRFDSSGPLNVVVPPQSVNYRELLKGNVIPNLTAMVTRLAVGTRRFERAGHEDYLFWLAVLQGVERAWRLPSPAPVADYRVHAGSLSGNKLRVLSWQWRIYRHWLGLSLPYSAYLMAHYAYRALRKRQRGPVAQHS